MPFGPEPIFILKNKTTPEKPDAIEKRMKPREEINAKQREQMKKDMGKEIDSPE